MFVMAMAVNLTPLLFVTLQDQFGLSFEQVGRLVLFNFTTQLLIDLACAGLVDRINAKWLAVSGNALVAVGLWTLALSPFRLETPYLGLVVGTVIFSAGCGLLEVIVSPIVERTPGERKAAGMALLHAFYPIGKVVVVVVTGLLFFAFGTAHWPHLVLGWSLVPVLVTLAFAGLRLPPMFEIGRRTRVRDLLRQRATWLAILAIALAGAAEVGMAQWASAFAERGLGVDKLTADLLGLGSFGVGMAVGRLWFGMRRQTIDMIRLMRRGATGAALMCLVMAFSGLPWLSLLATAAAGLFVSLLWPGMLSLTSARFPLAGASLFALLAAGGHGGAGVMPWLVGIGADLFQHAPEWLAGDLAPEQIGLRLGLALAAVPALVLVGVLGRWRALTA
jgi:fucose permease